MARTIWSGIISFGLVNIPVRMQTTVRKRELHFHQLHKKDNVRIKYKLVCPAENKEVPRDEIVRGYEIGPDQYVVVEDEELEAVAPEASRSIEIFKFVDLSEIDPIYFDRPYYLLPDKNAGKSYGLFVEALEQSQKVGICKFIMRTKEYLAALRSIDGVICAEIMHFAEEVTQPADLEDRPERLEVNPKELKIAQQLIDALTDEFDPNEFHNEFIDRVEEMVEKKAEGEVITKPRVEKRPAKVIDLMDALERSLASAKKRSSAAEPQIEEVGGKTSKKKSTKKKAKAPAKETAKKKRQTA